MPYKNITWIKLKFIDLMTDPDRRFVDLLNDEQKGLYLMLLLLMGYYKNQIPNDPPTLQRVLNLSEKPEKIAQNLDVICKVFSRGIRKSHFLKFKNYNKFHNPIGKSEGNPQDTPQDSTRVEESRVEKSRVYIYKQEFLKRFNEVTGVPYIFNFGKDNKLLKELLIFDDKDALLLINEFFDSCKEKVWWADKLSIGVFKTVIPQL